MNAFTEIFSTNFLAVYAAKYMEKVLHFEVSRTGHLTALTRVVQVPCRLGFGLLSDRIGFWEDRTKLVVFNTITVAGAGVFYFLIGFVPDSAPYLAVACIGMLNAVTGAASGGFYKMAVLYTRWVGNRTLKNLRLTTSFGSTGECMIALKLDPPSSCRQYSPFVVANCQFLKSIVLVLGPALVSLFVGEQLEERSRWRHIFLLAAGFLMCANCVFYWFASAQPAYYTQDDYINRVKEERRRREKGQKIHQIEVGNGPPLEMTMK